MKRIQSIVYLVFIFGSILLLIVSASSLENPFSLYENPLVAILMVMVALVISVKELVNVTAQKMAKDLVNEKAGIVEEKVDQWAWINKLKKKFTKSKEIEKESEIVLDHNYDGIRELDNVLPPWWVYMFYATIIFGVIYFVRFHMGQLKQVDEYTNEVAMAKEDLAAYKAATPDAFDLDKAELLTDEGALSRGKAIFKLNCASCHADDGGGGIGPNLTDKHWILGGGYKNIVNTLLKGGREGKGMISWKSTLKPEDIQKAASYVWSLQGKTTAKPKEPQGDVWAEEEEAKSDTPKAESSEEKPENSEEEKVEVSEEGKTEKSEEAKTE